MGTVQAALTAASARLAAAGVADPVRDARLLMAEALGIGNTPARVLAAGAFALSPRVLTTLGSISSETLPVMLAPWVLLPVIRAMRGDSSPRVLAARAGVAMALMGAVNAVGIAGNWRS